MLKKVCDECPNMQDCFNGGACLLLLIAFAAGRDEVEFSELAMPGTDYTDEANITETLLPHLDNNALDYED